MQTNKELPPDFKTWTQMYRELKKRSLLNEGTITFHSLGSRHNVQPYVFNVDFIKAKCFDELKEISFSVNEMDRMAHALLRLGLERNDPLVDKIKIYIDNLYELGLAY